MKKPIIVGPHKKDSGTTEWTVKPAGQTPVSTHRTQAAAIEAGRREAKRKETELLIQGRNGQIRSKDSYGNDPNPPKDREH
jgi:hypothetical protein